MSASLRGVCAVAVGLGALVAGTRPAPACSCAPPGLESPRIGATGVPINIRELVVIGPGPYELRRVDTDELVPTGPATPRSEQPYEGYYRLPVLAPLAPDAPYQVVGGVLEFRTGTAIDESPPGPIQLHELSFEVIDADAGNSSCEPSRLRTRSRLGVTRDTVSIGVRIHGDDGQTQEFLLAPGPNALDVLGTGSCQEYLALDAGHQYRVELWPRDLAANEGPITETIVDVASEGCGCRSASPSSAGLSLVVLVLWRRRPRRDRPWPGHGRPPASPR